MSRQSPGAAVASAPTGVPTGPVARDPRLAPTAGPPRRGLRGALRSAVHGTPGRMRLVAAIVVLAAAVFGVVGAQTLWTSSAALARADHNTTQVVRVQSIYADLLRADADATNGFLAGGLENGAQRTDYDGAITRVAKTIAQAAQAQPADGDALGALNQQFQAYTSLVEQARAYNRQGLPIGATYLARASAGLRSGALPIVEALTQANTARTTDEFTLSTRGVWLAATGAVALVVMLGGLVWLARRSHRYLNVPIVVGLVLVLVALVVGASTLSQVGDRISAVRGSVFQGTLDLATIRSAAYAAKADESLTLIQRGSGQASQADWVVQSALVEKTIAGLAADGLSEAGPLSTAWKSYETKHVAIRTTDDGGDYAGAVKAAIAAPTPAGAQVDTASVNGTFDVFTTATDTALAKYQGLTSERLLAPRGGVTTGGWALLLICLVSAGLALRGFGQRLEEYR